MNINISRFVSYFVCFQKTFPLSENPDACFQTGKTQTGSDKKSTKKIHQLAALKLQKCRLWEITARSRNDPTHISV